MITYKIASKEDIELLIPTFSHPTGKRAHLMNVYTNSQYRRQGIAYQMLEMLIDEAKEKGVKFMLPIDNRVGKEFDKDTESMVVKSNEIPDDWMGLDIGPETVELYSKELEAAETVLWNGPAGVAEFEQFAHGTNSIAKKLSEISAITVIGGGDSAAAVEKTGLSDKMTHISTGGGASLEFLEGKALPGIECLDDK